MIFRKHGTSSVKGGQGWGLEAHSRQREQHVQRVYEREVHGAFEELRKMGEEKARRGQDLQETMDSMRPKME